MQRLIFFAVAVCCFFQPLAALPADDFTDWLTGLAKQQLAARREAVSKITTRPQAEARQVAIREKLLRVYGGLPDYNGPLNAKTTGTLDAPTHRIEKVAFESFPGYWITANLYLPKAAGKHPAVLFSIGHWMEGKPSAQRIAANLAAKGFVVLAYDPMGQGERVQAYDRRLNRGLIWGSVEPHWLAGTQAILLGETLAKYFVWDSKRAIDYLVSRAEVDPDRIGATGCSGGGTQTTYVSALDPRVAVAAPLCYMNSFEVLYAGSIGDSEQSLPNFLSEGLDQSDYIAAFAPKPWFIGSTEEDFFTPAGAKIAYDDATRFYALFDSAPKVRWVLGPGGHGTPLPVREGLYGWMLQWLAKRQGDAREQEVKLFPNEDLQVTASGQVSVDYQSKDLVEILRDRLKPPSAKADLAAYAKDLVKPLDSLPALNGTEDVTFEPEPGLQVTGRILRPSGSNSLPGVVVVERGPKLSERAQQIAKAGAVVFAIVPRGLPAPAKQAEFGDWMAATRSWMVGRNLPGMRAQDIVTAARLLAARPDVAPGGIRGVADGVAGVWLLLASAVEPQLNRLWLDKTPWSLRSVLDSPVHRYLHDAVMPGFLLHGDLADLAKGREVRWAQPTDWNGNIVKRQGPEFYYRYFEEPDDRLITSYLLRP